MVGALREHDGGLTAAAATWGPSLGAFGGYGWLACVNNVLWVGFVWDDDDGWMGDASNDG